MVKTSMINETPVCFALWCFNSMPVSNFEILECPTCFCVHSSDQCQKQRPPPSKRLPSATLGRTWGHPCVSLCLLGADLLAHTPSHQTATQVLVKRKLGINSALSTHKGLPPLLSVDHLVEIPSQQYQAETNKSLIFLFQRRQKN